MILVSDCRFGVSPVNYADPKQLPWNKVFSPLLKTLIVFVINWTKVRDIYTIHYLLSFFLLFSGQIYSKQNLSRPDSDRM